MSTTTTGYKETTQTPQVMSEDLSVDAKAEITNLGLEQINGIWIVFALVILLISVPYFVVTKTLFSKYRYNTEPAHVHQINYFGTFSVSLIIALIDGVLNGHKKDYDTCMFAFVTLAMYATINLDMFVMQIDRFVALFWPYAYKAYVTVNRSIITVVITKVLGISSGCIAFAINREFGKCPFPREAAFKRPPALLLNSYPKVVIGSLVLFVSGYMVRVKAKSGNKIQPSSLNQQQGPSNRVRGDVNKVQDTSAPTFKHKSYHVNFKVKRKEGKVDEFIKIEIPELKPPNLVVQNEQNVGFKNFNTSMLLHAKSALEMNCYLLIFSISTTPQTICNIYYRNCNDLDNCPGFYTLSKIFIPLRLLGFIFPPAIAWYRIKKKKSHLI